MHVCVGSLNPVKFNAVKQAYKIYYNNIDVHKAKVQSNVPKQPIGLDITVKGAYNRAKKSLEYLKSILDSEYEECELFGVGIEAGLVNIPLARTNYLGLQFCVIMDQLGEVSIGSGVGFEYPEKIIKKVLSEKMEIGVIMGNLSGNRTLKREGGAISFLSKQAIKRVDILKEAVICALLPRINGELYSRTK